MQAFFTAAGLQVAWWTSVLPYLSSGRQLLLARPIPRSIGWAGFAAGMVVTCWLLTAVHHPVSAVIYWLCAVMVSWVLLVVSVPHLKRKSQVLAWGAVLASLTALLG